MIEIYNESLVFFKLTLLTIRIWNVTSVKYKEYLGGISPLLDVY